MTTLLQQAFADAAKLPEAEQDLLASRVLAELAAEDEFDRAIARSSDKLAALAQEALDEHRCGQTGNGYELPDDAQTPRPGTSERLSGNSTPKLRHRRGGRGSRRAASEVGQALPDDRIPRSID